MNQAAAVSVLGLKTGEGVACKRLTVGGDTDGFSFLQSQMLLGLFYKVDEGGKKRVQILRSFLFLWCPVMEYCV